jgi:hypothetical protein
VVGQGTALLVPLAAPLAAPIPALAPQHSTPLIFTFKSFLIPFFVTGINFIPSPVSSKPKRLPTFNLYLRATATGIVILREFRFVPDFGIVKTSIKVN